MAGELLEVEVADPEEDGGAVGWKPAVVTEVLPHQRFRAMVNGEDDFVEEYGMEDESREWRKVAPDDLCRVRKANEAAKTMYRKGALERQVWATGSKRRCEVSDADESACNSSRALLAGA